LEERSWDCVFTQDGTGEEVIFRVRQAGATYTFEWSELFSTSTTLAAYSVPSNADTITLSPPPQVFISSNNAGSSYVSTSVISTPN